VSQDFGLLRVVYTAREAAATVEGDAGLSVVTFVIRSGVPGEASP